MSKRSRNRIFPKDLTFNHMWIEDKRLPPKDVSQMWINKSLSWHWIHAFLRHICKVRTQDPENFEEEVKSLVTACWSFSRFVFLLTPTFGYKTITRLHVFQSSYLQISYFIIFIASPSINILLMINQLKIRQKKVMKDSRISRKCMLDIRKVHRRLNASWKICSLAVNGQSFLGH